MSQYTGLPNRE